MRAGYTRERLHVIVFLLETINYYNIIIIITNKRV